MNALTDFFAMGGYAAYVWPAYGIALVVLVANIVIPLRRLHRLKHTRTRPSTGAAARSINQ